MECACDEKALTKSGIRRILYIGDYDKSKKTKQIYKDMGIKYHRLHAADNNEMDLTDIFPITYKIILTAIQNNQRILVHCNQGVSRSSTIVIAYYLRRLYLFNEFDSSILFDVIKFVQHKRPCIEPNPNFVRQLVEYEQECAEQKT